MPARRHVLQLLSVSALAGACSTTPIGGPDPIAAWRNPGAGERDPRRWALAHAILAPNPHNRQPWLIDLPGTEEIVLYPDVTRLLPATDPPNRQITLGCGAFLELLDLAAKQRGLRADVTLWPEGEPQPVLDGRPVARVRLVPDSAVRPDPLFLQVTARHTNRQPFDLKVPPTADEIAKIVEAASSPGLAARIETGADTRAKLIALGWRGWQIETSTARTNMESVRLLRIGAAEMAANPDGIALQGPFIEAMKAAGVATHQALSDPKSFASKSGLDMFEKMLKATPAFFILKSADNSRATQIASGRAYARTQLAATALGLAMHPWSMTLQEFPEMAGPYRDTQALLGATPVAPVQMLVRLGRAKAYPTAPRWPMASHIRA